MKLIENHSGCFLEAGCDEAGRGCLAGPVVAAAVVLNPDAPIEGLNDSKKISEKQRVALREVIIQNALAWGVGIVSPAEIDEINILQASFLAMHRALDQLKGGVDFILVDGNRFKKYRDVPHACMVKGDARFQSIAAASILAKTHRDELMEKLHQEFPAYGWAQNKGYQTSVHREAILKVGSCEHHRKSFTLLPKQLSLF